MKHLLLLLGLGFALTANAQLGRDFQAGVGITHGEGKLGGFISAGKIESFGGELSFKMDDVNKLMYIGSLVTYELHIKNDISVVLGAGLESSHELEQTHLYNAVSNTTTTLDPIEYAAQVKIGVNIRNVHASFSYGISGFNAGVGYIFKR